MLIDPVYFCGGASNIAPTDGQSSARRPVVAKRSLVLIAGALFKLSPRRAEFVVG
ncbi:hypothetical protein D3C76_1205770 [compost metagenome]